MGTGPPITAAKRRRILELHAQGMGRNAIVTAVKVSAGTVTKVVHDAGGSFDRRATKAATEAKKADARARRADLSLALLEDAHRLRTQLWQPCKAFNFGGRDNTYNEVALDQPVFADQLKLMQAAGAAVQRHIDIERHDADQNAAGVASMLSELGRALGVRPPDDRQ